MGAPVLINGTRYKAPTSADFARAAQEWLSLYERLEKLQRAAEYAFNGVLEQIERYREGLGSRLRKAYDEIIEGEFEEAPSPSRPDEVASPASASALVEPPLSRSKHLPDPNRAALRNKGVASPLEELVGALPPRHAAHRRK
jgi:hypothetical protein